MTTDDPPWPDEYVVRRPAAVEAALDLKALRMLGPFMHGARTLSEAAAELEVGTSTLAYWIRKLERIGLLARLAPVRRNGMPMPRYRAVAQVLFLPFAAVPLGTTSDLLDGGRRTLLDRFMDGLDEVLRRAGHTGLQFKASGPSGIEIDIREGADGPGAAPWTDFWGTLHLTREQAKDFADDLRRLVERYRTGERGRSQFIVHAGIAPVPRLKVRSA